MKKRVFGRKLGRGGGARRALFRSLIRALVAEGAIETSKAKAKIAQRKTEKLVNLTKGKGVAKRHQVYAILGNDRETTDNLFNKIAPAFTDRIGGYTRIINLGRRRGDASEMARLEWVKEIAIRERQKVEKRKQKKTTKAEEDRAVKTRGKELIGKAKKKKNK